MDALILGITGASGSAYGVRILEEVLRLGLPLELIVSENGESVMEAELGFGQGAIDAEHGPNPLYARYSNSDQAAPPASGSHRSAGMIIAPCSMASLCEIAAGAGRGLIARAAACALKEGRRLVLVPRETPLSLIHLRAMTALAEAGAMILPAMPAFYHRPERVEDLVDFIAGRALEACGIPNSLTVPWKGPEPGRS